MTAPYDDAWARRKLARARVHLADLQQLTAGWVEPAEHPLRVELSENQREVRLVLDLSNPPPVHEWSLVIGDCVHNARTALERVRLDEFDRETSSRARQSRLPPAPHHD